MVDKYIPLGASGNADFIIGKHIQEKEAESYDLLTFDGTEWILSSNITLTQLTVTTLVATNTITTGDNLIVLNNDVTGSPTEDAGIEINRGSAPAARLLWNETTDTWQYGTVGDMFDIGSGSGGLDKWIESATGDLTANVSNNVTISIKDDGANDAVAASDLILQASNKTAGTGIGGHAVIKSGSSVGGKAGNIHLNVASSSGRVKVNFGSYTGLMLIGDVITGYCYGGPQGSAYWGIGGSVTHCYLKHGNGFVYSDFTQSRLLYGNLHVGWSTDGTYNFGENSGYMKRPAKGYFKTEVNIGNQAGEAGTLNLGGINSAITANATGYLEISPNGNAAAFISDTDRNVVVGAGNVATTATDGFLYIPTCAGIPTGTPTTFSGFVPLVCDTVNSRLYMYNGGWVALN